MNSVHSSSKVLNPTQSLNKQEPVSQIIVYGNSGLINSGNTCYMNSAIQSLSHLYPLTSYLFNQKKSILEILLKNARNILKDNKMFRLEVPNYVIPIELKKKIHDPNYQPQMLSDQETVLVLNSTMTFQLIRLLEGMWTKNCIIQPTSFRTIFSDVRDKFFAGYQQHDAEEAYSCIMQQIQEELSQTKIIDLKYIKQNIRNFLTYRVNINNLIKNAKDDSEKKEYLEEYQQKKKELTPEDNLLLESYIEMKKYYESSYSYITEAFTGFLHSSINCPQESCRYTSSKFDPYLHLSLPLPANVVNKVLTIQDCIKEFTKHEILDDKNLWKCEGCKQNVRAVKKLELWTCPIVLVIQLKRFGITRVTKDSRLVHYPMTDLDLSEIVSPHLPQKDEQCFKYTLQCVVNHEGSLNSGHYYAYCKDEDHDKWFVFNDERVYEIPKSYIITPHAYMLFYIRQDMIVKP